MSIKKTESDIREDIKKMEKEFEEATEYTQKCNFRAGKLNLIAIQSKLEYAKTLIDY